MLRYKVLKNDMLNQNIIKFVMRNQYILYTSKQYINKKHIWHDMIILSVLSKKIRYCGLYDFSLYGSYCNNYLINYSVNFYYLRTFFLLFKKYLLSGSRICFLTFDENIYQSILQVFSLHIPYVFDIFYPRWWRGGNITSFYPRFLFHLGIKRYFARDNRLRKKSKKFDIYNNYDNIITHPRLVIFFVSDIKEHLVFLNELCILQVPIVVVGNFQKNMCINNMFFFVCDFSHYDNLIFFLNNLLYLTRRFIK